MNPKQFINNGICYAVTKYNWINGIIKIFGLLLYPDYPIIPKISLFKSKKHIYEILKLYLLIFIVLFVIPSIWSMINDQFWSDNNPATTKFLEDYSNLWNYLLICELYIILGYYILKGNSNLKESLVKSSFNSLIDVSDLEEETKSKAGYVGLVILFVATFYFSAGYANDITTKSTTFYWFMATKEPIVTYSMLGFYYFFINFSLLFFVLIVAFSYVGFINKIGYISNKIKLQWENSEPSSLVKDWGDDNILKKKLAPITSLMLMLQLMVAIITLNIVLWNLNQQGIGINYNTTVFVLIILGVWIFTLPRYYVNFQIFRIWQKIGKNEYKNLSLPWMMGFSGLIDIILFTVLLSKLISDDWVDFLKNVIG